MNKSYSPVFKARLVQELLKETKTISQLAREALEARVATEPQTA